jgi:hypothetical protein
MWGHVLQCNVGKSVSLCLCWHVQWTVWLCLLMAVCSVTYTQTAVMKWNISCFVCCSLRSSNSCQPAYRHFKCLSNVCNLCALEGKGIWQDSLYILSTMMIKQALWIIIHRHGCTTSSHASCVHKVEIGNQNARESGFFLLISRSFCCAFSQ